MKRNTSQSLAQGVRDSLWLAANQKQLLARYRDQWVAVKGERVIAGDPDFDALLAKIPPADRGFVEIDLVTDDPMEMILWQFPGSS